MASLEPTVQDTENARVRAEIATRLQAEYDQCGAWAEEAFGPGYKPSCRHFLLDKETEDHCRRTGERPIPAATVYTVRHEQTLEKRHFVLRDDKPVAVDSMEAGFGAMLLEPHPTIRIEVGGEMVAPHRYSLCWAGYDTYKPRSAEQLASDRQRREERKVERAAHEQPLFAEQIREEGVEGLKSEKPKRPRSPNER